MLRLCDLLGLWPVFILLALGAAALDAREPRPLYPVPSLTNIRSILSQLEAPIVSALTERMNLVTNPSLYDNYGQQLLDYINPRERHAKALGRYDYGNLEYPFTLPQISPDKTTSQHQFPPGYFHQDTFNGNANITAFYLQTLVPLYFTSSTSFFYHLTNSTENDDAALNLDATLLALLSHRSHIGKIVAETKYAANVTGFGYAIKLQDSDSIRSMVTNLAQVASVLEQASSAASNFSSAWVGAGAIEDGDFYTNLQNASAALFNELTDITTEIEIQYLLSRFT